MKIQTKNILTIETQLNAIEKSTFVSKTNHETTIILLKTSDGTFTNYKEVWDKLNIDIDSLNAGDKISINYTTFFDEHKNRTFKNFISVKTV